MPSYVAAGGGSILLSTARASARTGQRRRRPRAEMLSPRWSARVTDANLMWASSCPSSSRILGARGDHPLDEMQCAPLPRAGERDRRTRAGRSRPGFIRIAVEHWPCDQKSSVARCYDCALRTELLRRRPAAHSFLVPIRSAMQSVLIHPSRSPLGLFGLANPATRTTRSRMASGKRAADDRNRKTPGARPSPSVIAGIARGTHAACASHVRYAAPTRHWRSSGSLRRGNRLPIRPRAQSVHDESRIGGRGGECGSGGWRRKVVEPEMPRRIPPYRTTHRTRFFLGAPGTKRR